MRVRRASLLILAIAVVQALTLTARATPAHPVERRVLCGNAEYRYLLLTPGSSAPLPGLVLLHGAGDSPEPMLEAWQQLALAERIVLIAPALPRRADFEPLAPGVFECMVEDSKAVATLDTHRVYVFGNSMGGYLTYDAALLQSQYFAAAAVHAMCIDADYSSIVDKATRKIPLAIYAGDRDSLVPIERVIATRDLLLQHGFPVHFVEIAGHDHNYYAVSDKVNRDAWKFLQQSRLP